MRTFNYKAKKEKTNRTLSNIHAEAGLLGETHRIGIPGTDGSKGKKEVSRQSHCRALLDKKDGLQSPRLN
jgi:hypothetical protein